MFKRYALLLTVFVAAVALLGATGCTKKKMMGHSPAHTMEHAG